MSDERCPYCGHTTEPGARHCPNCKHQLEEPKPAGTSELRRRLAGDAGPTQVPAGDAMAGVTPTPAPDTPAMLPADVAELASDPGAQVSSSFEIKLQMDGGQPRTLHAADLGMSEQEALALSPEETIRRALAAAGTEAHGEHAIELRHSTSVAFTKHGDFSHVTLEKLGLSGEEFARLSPEEKAAKVLAAAAEAGFTMGVNPAAPVLPGPPASEARTGPLVSLPLALAIALAGLGLVVVVASR